MSHYEQIRAFVTTKREEMKRWAMSLTGNAYDADDLVQDTIVKVLERHEKFSGGNIAGWVHQIMKFHFLDWREREVRYSDNEITDVKTANNDFESIDEYRGDGCGDGVDTYEYFEEAMTLKRAMKSIDERYRIAVMMFAEGYTYLEIGAHLGISPNQTASYIKIGRDKLKAFYKA